MRQVYFSAAGWNRREQEGIANLVALENPVPLARRRPRAPARLCREGLARLQKLRIGGVVDQPDAVRRGFRNETGDVARGSAGDGDGPIGALDAAAQTEGPRNVQQSLGIVEKQAAQIVNRHHIRLRHQQWYAMKRNVGQIGAAGCGSGAAGAGGLCARNRCSACG